MSRLLYRLSYPAMGLLPACWSVNRARSGGIPPVRGGTGDEVRAPMRNRTADLLLTMETLYRLSYWGLAALRQRAKAYPEFEGTQNPSITVPERRPRHRS